MYRILIVADILMVAVFGFFYNRLPPQIPLFYSHSWGEEQIADIWFIALIPGLLHIFYLTNFFLQKKVFKDNPPIKNMIHITNLFIIVAFTFIFIRIILAVV